MMKLKGRMDARDDGRQNKPLHHINTAIRMFTIKLHQVRYLAGYEVPTFQNAFMRRINKSRKSTPNLT